MNYGIIGWVVIGLIAGALAKWIMPGRVQGGILITILVGIAGGLVGGFLASVLPFVKTGGDIWNLGLATVGAVLLLWLYGKLKSNG